LEHQPSTSGRQPIENVTNTIIWPQRPSGTISPDSHNGFLRSNLPYDRRSQWQQTAESALEANKIHSSEFALSANLWCFWLHRHLAFSALNYLLRGQIMLS
jgi:hypothetical protein